MNEQNNSAVNLNSESVKYGFILGLFSVVTYLLSYLIDPSLLIKWWFGILFLVGYIVALVFISKAIRKSAGGFITFKKLFVALAIVMVVSSVLSTAFQFVLYKVIDPQLETTLRDELISSTSQWMLDFGMSDEEVEKATEKMHDQSFAPNATSLVGILIFSVIIALIFAAIFKKKSKDEDYEQKLTA